MKIVSFQKIADSLNVTKQAVDKLFVKKGLLKKNQDGKIDIEDPFNFEFLISKGADFAKMGVVLPPENKNKEKVLEVRKKTDGRPDMPGKPETEGGALYRLQKELQIENIKQKRISSELNSIKIKTMQGELIPRKMVDQLIGDFFGRFNEMLLIKPKGIIGDIKAEVKDGTDQTLISYLQKVYMIELEKLLQNAKKRYLDAIENQIKEIKEDGE